MTLLENPVYVLGVLCFMVILSVKAAKTKLGSKFGAALLVIVFTAVLANLGLIPSASNTIFLYDGIFTYLAPISIFYLLLGVNLRSIRRAGTPMILLFIIGSLATTLAFIIAWVVVSPQDVIGADANIIAGMFTGTYTGGSVNFNAVALEYDFQERGILYAGTIAVDNVITTVWIAITLLFPTILRKFWKDRKIQTNATQGHEEADRDLNLNSLMWLLFLGIAAYLISETITQYVPQIPSILTISTLGILMAQSKFIARLSGSHLLGLYLVYLFLAVIGAYCELSSVIELGKIGVTLFMFGTLGVLLHGIIIILLGAITFRDWEMIAIASQANIGGGTTAMALAETFKRSELILPAILVGSLGSALGTYLGFLVIGLL